MKYIARFSLKDPLLPSDYRPIFVSFFKKALSDHMEGYFYEDFYGEGAKKKDLCWSLRLGQPKFEGRQIRLGQKDMDMTLKFQGPKAASLYFTALLKMKGKDFPIGLGNTMVLKSLRLVPEKDILGDVALFKILSPLCLRKHDRTTNKDRYLTVEEEDFEVVFKEKLREERPDLDQEIQDLVLDFSKLKKIVVPAYKIPIDCSLGTFLAQGDKALLNHIQHGGLGSRRASGFGLVENIYI
ncbi:MAG: CRISPR-associated endoribonuclease Cas6 [Tissierellia bacterium]|nr:CRISPR-associated endoribonuclease Cas6 [Tissierellia bacterium]